MEDKDSMVHKVPEHRELHPIDVEPVVFEWTLSQGEMNYAAISRNPQDDGGDELCTGTNSQTGSSSC